MAESVKGTLKTIPLKDIRENPDALRDVNKTTEEYLGLVDSVKTRGVMIPILVRELKGENGQVVYGLIDGLQRYSAAMDAGHTEIHAHVQDMENAEVLEAQLIANVHKIETKAVEYSKQLVKILSANPVMRMADLAAKLNKSGTWLSERLGLLKLTPEIQALVNDQKINLSNAFALAKLPPEEQVNFLDRAQTQSPQEFVPTATQRVKEIKEAKRQGKAAAPAEFVPVPHARRMSELKDELTNPTVGPALCTKQGVKDAKSGFALGVAWALHMDNDSIAMAKEKDTARKTELAEAKKRRDLERAQKKQKDAADTVAELTGK
jgi:ParB/RepB/Spo0J family partition protein